MSIDVSWPLRCAIKSKIQHDERIVNLMGGEIVIGDGDTGRGHDLPSIYIGNAHAQAWHSATFDGQEHEINIHVVTDVQSTPHIQEISGAIIDSLHDADLILSGHALVDMQFERSVVNQCLKRQQFLATVSFKALTVCD